jgi:hypothetical protein
MHFQVLLENEPARVTIDYAGEEDLDVVKRRRVPRLDADRPGVRDSLKFARLAAKRWRYYRKSMPTVLNPKELQRVIAADPQAEASLLLLARADWYESSPIVGIAQCRRTYCHHLILEFLAVHPRILSGRPPRVRGIGSGLLCGLVELASQMGIKNVWGEATASSAEFYQKTLGTTEIQDNFTINGALMEHCKHKFREEMMGKP